MFNINETKQKGGTENISVAILLNQLTGSALVVML